MGFRDEGGMSAVANISEGNKMSFDEIFEKRIREIVQEELKGVFNQGPPRLEPWELAQRWNTTTDAISRLVRSGRLKAIRLSERKMIFTMEEVLRFENAGGVEAEDVAA